MNYQKCEKCDKEMSDEDMYAERLDEDQLLCIECIKKTKESI
jgi:hypothetical protein